MSAAASDRERAGDASDSLIEAVGKASEALEYVERARGHLYSFHQLIGRADLLFGEAADRLREGGAVDAADAVDREIVGRNVLDGRWTFQVVEEFDDLYHETVRDAVRGLEATFQEGQRHVYEARLKEQRRTRGRAGHERRPLGAHDDRVEIEDPERSEAAGPDRR